jgi:MFS family permease
MLLNTVEPHISGVLLGNNFPGNVRTFNSLKSSTFRNYYFGMMGQWISANMQIVTQSFLVYYLTGSAAILGTTALATALPQLALLLFGGALADRVQKKRLLQLSQLGECCSALIILVALLTGYLSKGNVGTWWILIMTSTFSGIFNGLAMPARQAMIAEIVNREQLMNAVSLNSMGQNLSTLIGPAIAGFLIGGVGYQAVYGTMVGLYLVAITLTNFLPVTRTISSSNRNTLADIKEGLRYIKGNRILLFIIVFNLICFTVAMPRTQLMPIFAVDILKVGASGQGILQSLSAVGALAASLFYASLRLKKRGIIMIYAGLSLGLALAVFAFSRSYLLSIVMMIFVGMGQTGHIVMGNILLQSLSDKEYVGRVMSVLLMCAATSNLGTFFVGIITQFSNVQIAVGSLGIFLVLVTVACLVFFPWVRNVD